MASTHGMLVPGKRDKVQEDVRERTRQISIRKMTTTNACTLGVSWLAARKALERRDCDGAACRFSLLGLVVLVSCTQQTP